MGRETAGHGGSADLVEVARAADQIQAGMFEGLLNEEGIRCFVQPIGIDGPTVGVGLLPRGPQRVMVRADQAEAAQTLLAEALVEVEAESPADIANARHLDEAAGRGPRGYGLLGAYARIWFWSLAAIGAAFGVFMLLRLV